MRTLAVALALSLAPGLAAAQAAELTVDRGGASRIQFVSDAPLETITGVSSHVTGTVHIDPEDLSSARGRVAVRVASLRTGIDLRDSHLRGDGWLDAASHPEAIFELTRLEGAARLAPNEVTRVRARGRFTIHGVTRDVVARARLRWVPGGTLHVRASFTVRLTDHDISVPLPMRLKVANEIRVNVTVRASRGG